MNVHTPERASNESQKAYRKRRAMSHKIIKAIRSNPPHATHASDGTPYMFEEMNFRVLNDGPDKLGIPQLRRFDYTGTITRKVRRA